MGRRIHLAILAVTASALVAQSLRASATPDPVFFGTVVDRQGKPVEGAELCGQWGPAKPDATPRCLGRAAITDSSGQFKMSPPMWADRLGVLVFDPSHTSGALVSIEHPDFSLPLRVELHPLQPVHYRFVSPTPVKPMDCIGHLYSPLPSAAVFGFVLGSEGVVLLPPGKYEIWAHVVDSDNAHLAFAVDNHGVNLPPLKLVLSNMARVYGLGHPHISALVDMERKPYRIGSLNGRWTLLYFWETGCVPCIEHGMPELIAFTKAHPDQAGRLRIVGVHTRRADTPAAWGRFHEGVLRLESTLWHNAPTFPMLYDESSRTSTSWGIRMWPTYALIDPQGKLVRVSNFADVQSIVGIH